MCAGFAGTKTGHRGAVLGRSGLFRIAGRGTPASSAPLRRRHPRPVPAVGGEYPGETRQVDPRLRDQGHQPGDEVERLEDDVCGAIAVGGLQLGRSCASLRPRHL